MMYDVRWSLHLQTVSSRRTREAIRRDSSPASGERWELRTMPKKPLLPALLATALLGVAGCQQSPQTQNQTTNAPPAKSGNASPSSQPPAAPETHLKVGDTAP